MSYYQEHCYNWFAKLRERVISTFEEIERHYDYKRNNCINSAKFSRKKWERAGGGGGEMAIMRGNVFAKVGVNISKVYGDLPNTLYDVIPDAPKSSNSFFATGISIVAHMRSPLVPAVHFNTRYLETTKYWFGGGSDLTPLYPDTAETEKFHHKFRMVCNKYDSSYYNKFKKACDNYFFLHHRQEPRGVGGIFYDYFNNNNFQHDFSFTQDVGLAFLDVYPEIVRAKMFLPWTDQQYEELLIKRGRYVEFNLLHDRGTKFGLMTGGNIEAILMSLPPEVKWQ